MTTSIARQTVTEMGGASSILARQRADHAELYRLLTQARTATGAEQEELLTRLYRLVFTHAFAEESVLWPTLRRVLPDRQELTLRNEVEHQQVNELAVALERSRPGDPGREELMEQVLAWLETDARDEEDVILPRLQAALTPRHLRLLGFAWEFTRRVAPTHPHPVVSRRPPGNVLAAVPLSVLDRSRDRLDQLARRSPAVVARTSRAASGVLAALAARVERLGPLRHGDLAPTHV